MSNGDRNGVQNVIYFIQQDNVIDYQNTQRETNNAQNAGIWIFSVGINSNIDPNHLREFSTGQEQQNREWYIYNDPSEADRSINSLLNVVCNYQITPTTSPPGKPCKLV